MHPIRSTFVAALVFCLGCSLDSSPVLGPDGKPLYKIAEDSGSPLHLVGAAGRGGVAGAGLTAGAGSGAAGRALPGTGGASAASAAGAGAAGGTAGHAGADASVPVDAGTLPDADAGAGVPAGLTCMTCKATSDCAPGYACMMPVRGDTDGPLNRCYLVDNQPNCPTPLSVLPVSGTTVEGLTEPVCVSNYTCVYWLMHPMNGL
jgi:hypothetical protein